MNRQKRRKEAQSIKRQRRQRQQQRKNSPIVVIIPCSEKKAKYHERQRPRALDYYNGPLWTTFRKILAGVGSAANIQNWWIDEWEIAGRPVLMYAMSAKYGLIPITKKIQPYDVLLKRDVSPKKLEAKIKRQIPI